MSDTTICELSVVIPVYNAVKTIRRCVDSVLAEVAAVDCSYEIILVDDGSTDASLAVCTEMSQKNKHILVFTQKNAGPSAARNLGIKMAKGKFIALNDSDDEWISGRLCVLLNELKADDSIGLVSAKYGACLRAGKRTEITYNREVFHNFFSPPTSVFRRQAFVCGFCEDQKYSEDMRFLLDFMRSSKCVYIPLIATMPVFEKCVFADSGLSAHIWLMEKGEIKNILYAHKIKKINCVVMILAMLWSLVKFVRRVLIFALIRTKKIIRSSKSEKEVYYA